MVDGVLRIAGSRLEAGGVDRDAGEAFGGTADGVLDGDAFPFVVDGLDGFDA